MELNYCTKHLSFCTDWFTVFLTLQRSCMLSTHSDEITSEVEFPLANDETDITILCAVHARECLCMNV